MQDQSDLQLLRDYAQTGSEAAFRELVMRHTNFVFSAALRQVESPDLAGDLAQSVFTDLARKARPLTEKMSAAASLVGWLHRSTRYAALNHLRDTRRRQTNERLAMEQLLTNAAANPDWDRIRPLLDEALDSLADDDREAILLRYFKNHDFRAVGLALGVNDDTAQKRVSRAVDQLREFFTERKVTIGASGLIVVISANAVQAAPAGLAAAIATATLAGTAATTSTAVIAAKTIAMTTLQKIVVTAAFVAAAGAGIFEARQAAQLRDQNQSLQQQLSPLTSQVQQLQSERDDATNRLAALADELAKIKSNNLELLKLRGEVTQLREAGVKTPEDEAREAMVKSWLAREDQLKQLVKQYPDKTIPEFQLLSEQQWLDAAMDAKLDTDKHIQNELAGLRHQSENIFASQIQVALTKYLKDNNSVFPTDLSQLQPYFSSPMDDAILQRWEIAPSSAVPGVGVGGDTIITEKAAVDESVDGRWAIGPNGFGNGNWESSDTQAAIATMKPVLQAYAADHNGAQPTDPSQIQPYLTTPEQSAAFQTLMKNESQNSANP